MTFLYLYCTFRAKAQLRKKCGTLEWTKKGLAPFPILQLLYKLDLRQE